MARIVLLPKQESTMKFRSIVAVSLLAVVVAASGGRAEAGNTVLTAHMHGRDAAAQALLDALVHGDLDGAQGLARAWPSVPPRDLPSGLVKNEARLDAAIARITKAGSIDEAAAALGAAAVECGACHSAAGAQLPVKPTEPPSTGDGVRAEMQRHDLAITGLWWGIVRPAPADLDAAAALFASTTLDPVGGPTPEVTAFDDETTRRAALVASAPNANARGERFGDLVVACAACHLLRPGGITLDPE
jgi:mono/diheme cytochrome c family protein